MIRLVKMRLRTATVACLSLLYAHGAMAQETINVTVLSGYTDRTVWIKTLKDYWMPEVNKRLAEAGNYQLKYLEAFGSVVQPRGEFDAIGSGIGNIGLVVTAFHTDKVPLSSVSYVTPFVTVDLALTSEVNDALTFSIDEMKAGWQKFGLEFIGHMGAIKSYNVLSKKPIESLDDFKGIKVSGAGLNLRWLEGLGVTGVPTALPKFYQEMSSGVSDAMIGWADVIGAFKLCEVAPNFLSADMGSVSNFAMVANKAWFDDLPEEVQDVIRDVTPDYRNLLAKLSTQGDAQGRKDCVTQGGNITEISAQMRQDWAERLPNIAKQWASSIDETGLPGTEVLSAYMDKMREAKQPIAREWDKE